LLLSFICRLFIGEGEGGAALRLPWLSPMGGLSRRGIDVRSSTRIDHRQSHGGALRETRSSGGELDWCRREIVNPATMLVLQRLDALQKPGASRVSAVLCREAIVLFNGEDNGNIASTAVNDGGPTGRIAKDLGKPALRFRNAEPPGTNPSTFRWSL
jgi:hypothetical protein